MAFGVSRNADDAVRQQFFKIFDRANMENWSPDELSEVLADFEGSLTPGQAAYLARNTGMSDTPRVKEYRAAQKVLRPYFDISREVWDRLSTKLPDAERYGSAQDYTNGMIMEMQDAGVPDAIIARRVQTNPVIKEITRTTRLLHERYREQHPDVDAELVRWYGAKAIRQ